MQEPAAQVQEAPALADERVHLGDDVDADGSGVLVILLGGGKEKSQQHDIATAEARWKDYKQRKSQEK